MNDMLQAPSGQPAPLPAGLLHRLLGQGRTTFYAAAGIVLAGVLGAGYGLYHLIELRIDYQEQRNVYLKGEMLKLDAQLAQLDKPRKEAMAVQNLGQAMQYLYNAKAMDTGMFNFLAREIPPGVQLTYAGLDQGKLKLHGLARSRGEVDGLMHAIEASPWLDRAKLVSSAEREEQGRRLQEFTIEAWAGYFRKPGAASNGKRGGGKQKAASAAPPSSGQPVPVRDKPAVTSAPSGDENTTMWAAAGLAAGLALLASGWLFRRWRSKRAPSAGQREPFFERAAAQFDVLDPHDVTTWGLIPRIAVLFELAVVAGMAAWFVLGTAFDDYSEKIMVEEKLKDTFIHRKNTAVNLDLMLAQYSQIKRAYAPVINAFPARVDADGFDAGIRNAARKAGVSLMRTNRESANSDGAFPSVPVSVRVAGSFDGIGAFVGSVVKMKGVVVLQSFDLIPDEPGGKGGKNMQLRFNATLVSHANRPAGSAAEMKKGAAK